ncbi:MAG: hypothetical protein K5695_15460 [Oscillospiraceae bacterium]|nr:hypothetical protein [Oscillospiraceae bacterium]
MSEKKKQEHPWRSRHRSAEILAVFTKHNFYSGGFTPEELRTTLEDLGPTYVKIGQIMSSRTDILPEAYCRELEKLRSNVKPLDAADARAVIEAETGKKIEDIYSEFRDDPLGSASIAQAHYGVLKDGTKVVTKVQRPLIAEMVRQDFVLLKKLAAVVNVATEGETSGSMVDLKSVIEELEKVTEDELDFRVEADNTRIFRNLCIEDEHLVSCPRIIDELTTERILTQTFVDGYPISNNDRIDADGIDRTEVGKLILENYLHQVLDVGIFHGDPHQGNIMLSHGIPYWIDFGMIGHISEQNIGVIQEIILALVEKSGEDLTNTILTMGITSGKINKQKLTEDLDGLIDRHVAVKDLSRLNMGALMTDLTALLSTHHITMPGEFTMLVRSFVTIEGVLESFCPELNVFDAMTRKMTERMRESFDLKQKFAGAMQELVATGRQATKIPSAVVGLLRNLAKGRMKIAFEMTGYEDLLERLAEMEKALIMAIFASVLFVGSCTLCTTDIQPQVDGIPIVALIGFVLAAALALHTLLEFWKKK